MRRHVPAIAADFASVLSLFRERGLIAVPPPGKLLEQARRIHRATYSLILWRFRLKNLPQHSQVFIEEIASDALQILPQTMMGYGKTAKLLTRGVIENTIRHIYFADHPIEFARMNRDQKWYIGVDALFDYLKSHPLFLDTEGKFDAISKLSSLYSELSAGVHGRTIRDLEMRTALSKITYSEQAAETQAACTERCVEAANFLLAMFHASRMDAFQVEDRRIILQTMTPRARVIWTHHGG